MGGKVNISLLLGVLLILAMVIGLTPTTWAQTTQDDAGSGGDAADTSSSAFTVSSGTNYTGMLGDLFTNIDGDSDNDDYYGFTPSTAGYISVYFEILNPENFSLVTVSVLKNGFTVVIESLFSSDPAFTLVAPVLDTTSLDLHIQSYSDSVSYIFFITNTDGSYSQDDASTGGDTELLTGTTVQLDTSYTGDIGNGNVDTSGYLDSSDYFYIDVAGEGYLSVDVSGSSDESYTDLSVFVLTSAGETIFSDSLGLFSASLNFKAPIAVADRYILMLDSLSWNTTYSFTLSFIPAVLPSQNDAGSGGDASNEFSTAPTVGVNSTFTGTVGEGLVEVSNNARDDYDLYLLGNLSYGQLSVNISLVGSNDSYPSVYLDVNNNSDTFSPDYLSIRASSYSPFDSDSVVLTAGDQYYLSVWTFDLNVTYTVSTIFIELPEPVTTTEASSTSTTSTSTVSSTVSTSTTSTEASSDPVTSTSTTSSAQTVTSEETSSSTEDSSSELLTDTASLDSTTAPSPLSFTVWVMVLVILPLLKRRRL